jgi:hypothetical protein
LLETNNKKRLVTGLFILLAVGLLGYNAINFASIYDSPLMGASMESRSASEKWRRLEGLLKEKGVATGTKLINFKSNEAAPDLMGSDVKVAGIISDEQIAQGKKGTSDDELPVVMGLMKTIKSDGRSQISVIINNKPFSENEVVAGFLIKQITEKGIYLTKGKRNWFVKTPDISYSMDRGN